MTDPIKPDEEPSLTGSGGHDLSGGTSVSGVGGQTLRNENDDAGLRPVAEQAALLGGSADAADSEEPVAGNDGTGQSERPPD